MPATSVVRLHEPQPIPFSRLKSKPRFHRREVVVGARLKYFRKTYDLQGEIMTTWEVVNIVKNYFGNNRFAGLMQGNPIIILRSLDFDGPADGAKRFLSSIMMSSCWELVTDQRH